MNSLIGKLNFVSAKDRQDLIPQVVHGAILRLSDNYKILVAEINPEFSDSVSFCSEYQIDQNHAANCLVLEAKRGDKVWHAACVIPSNSRADINGLARRTLNARRVSFLPMEQAIKETNMEYGAITPIGLPFDWPILIDKAVADLDYVIIGGGFRKLKLAIPGNILFGLASVTVLEGLGILLKN